MFNKNIKIAFFDIDGTLTNNKKEVLKSTIDTLNKANEIGIKLVLCSGRSNEYLLKYASLFNNIDYLISSNGARIYDIKNDKNIFVNTLTKEDIVDIYNFTNKNKLCLTITSDILAYINNYTQITNEDIYMRRIININDILDKNLYQLIVVNNNIDNMINLENYLKNKSNLKLINYSLSYLKKEISNYYFFDIVSIDVNKGTAINKLLEYTKINKDESICFGDSVNDLDMFKSCGISVAMGNAIDELKKESDFITDSNEFNGISKFFENNIFSD